MARKNSNIAGLSDVDVVRLLAFIGVFVAISIAAFSMGFLVSPEETECEIIGVSTTEMMDYTQTYGSHRCYKFCSESAPGVFVDFVRCGGSCGPMIPCEPYGKGGQSDCDGVTCACAPPQI